MAAKKFTGRRAIKAKRVPAASAALPTNPPAMSNENLHSRGKVVSILRDDPRPPDAMRALALMREALRLLDGLVERGEVKQGTCPALTADLLDNAIGMLRPSAEDGRHG